MSNIFIVRHGQDEDNAAGVLNGHRDKPLTNLGRDQAATVAKKLIGADIKIILSSPLKRARETAQIIAYRLGIDGVKIEPKLIERDFGVMTGQPIANIAKLSNNNIQGDKVLYFLDPEGAEKFPELLDRAKRVLLTVKDNYSSENVLLVTHGDTGKMIRAAYHGWGWKEGLMKSYFDNTGVLELKPESDIIE